MPAIDRGSVCLLACLLVACALVPCRAAQALPGFREIAPGVYLRPGVQQVANADNLGHIANLGFVVGERRVAVIDSGGSYAEGRGVLDAVAAVTDLPVAALILTHMHPDHALGAAAFVERGIPVIGHERLGDALQRRADAYLGPARAYLGEAAEGTRIVVPDVGVAVGEDYELDLGGRVLRLTAHPTAHTNNDLSVQDDSTGLSWLGDLLFVDHLPVVDGSLRGWLHLLDGLDAMQPSLVVPGHGAPPDDWRAAVARQRRYLQGLADQVRAALARGADLRSVIDAAAAQHGDWLLFDEFHGRNLTAAYVELEWE